MNRLRQMDARPIAWLAAALSLLAGPSLAQGHDPLEGAWEFQSGRFANGDDNCELHGTAVFTRQAQAGRFRVALSAHQACRSGDISGAEQACDAVRNGATVTINCRVVRANDTYVADNFVVTLGASGRMRGRLISASNAEVIFFRTP